MGGKFIRREKDVNSDPIMTITRGPNGQEQRGWASTGPALIRRTRGALSTAQSRGLYPGSGCGGQGQGSAVQALAQGAAAAQPVLLVTLVPYGARSEQASIPEKAAAVMAGFGAGGRVAGAAASATLAQVRDHSGLIDTQMGRTERGLAAGTSVCRNPDELAGFRG